MKPIKVIKDGRYKDVYVFKDDIIEPTKENIEMIEVLNRQGFIEPLDLKTLIKIKKEVESDGNSFSKIS